MDAYLKESFITGIVGLVIGVVIGYLATFVWPTPWNLTGGLIAVGVASFFAAFGGLWSPYRLNRFRSSQCRIRSAEPWICSDG
jgi:ABC-type antimicrobial peptide transport system permease subunit